MPTRDCYDLLDAATKLAGAIGVICGIFYTGNQISQSSQQIEQANNTEKAKLIYTIQKDGRALFQSLSNDIFFSKCVISNQNCNKGEILEAKKRIRTAIQFYSSVYNQKELEQLLPKYWTIWRRDLCGFTANETVRSFWKDVRTNKSYSDGFRKEMDECAK